MKTEFKDYFSGHAEDYSKYRPSYPTELFTYLASISDQHQTAWDCATGNGQSAVLLSGYFSKVIATDASDTQIENAVLKKGVSYHVATAENSKIKSNSIDLVAVAQAFHWFSQNAFILEVDRVLKDKGIIAIWTYNLLSVNKGLDKIIYHLYDDILGDYWAFERGMVEEGYKNVQLPFDEVLPPIFSMSAEWNLSQFIGYFQTWSAVKKYQQEKGHNPVEALYSEIKKAWGDTDALLPITWPLSVKIWRK